MPQVCADDQKTCCTTPPLKKTFSDDWSANDLEQWGPDYFGWCNISLIWWWWLWWGLIRSLQGEEVPHPSRSRRHDRKGREGSSCCHVPFHRGRWSHISPGIKVFLLLILISRFREAVKTVGKIQDLVQNRWPPTPHRYIYDFTSGFQG